MLRRRRRRIRWKIWNNSILNIKDLRAAVLAEVLKGGNPFAIPETLQLPEYQNFSGYDSFFPLNVQVIIWWPRKGKHENFQAVLIDMVLGPLGWRPDANACSCNCTNSTRNWNGFILLYNTLAYLKINYLTFNIQFNQQFKCNGLDWNPLW